MESLPENQNYAGQKLVSRSFRHETTLAGADFRGSDLRSTDFRGVDLRGAKFDGARMGQSTRKAIAVGIGRFAAGAGLTLISVFFS
jgi:uncharacterized protein YjbI with pentapeptide repeats